MDRLRLTDVSPRDGLQNERGVVPAADKARLIELLERAGPDEIEATSFVSPKWVPQLADAEEVLRLVQARRAGEPDRARPVLSVLVPNERGFERALAIHRGGLPLKVAVFTAASETFSQKNTNATIAETVERFAAFLPRAFDEGMAVRMYVSCAVACPFEGPIAPERVRRVVDMLLGLAPRGSTVERMARAEIDLGDTIGVARPADIAALLSTFTDAERRLVTMHLHDTHGRAAESVRTAVGMGVRSFDGSAAGIGGCPYASTAERRAPGNIDTRVLVRAARDAGLRTDVVDAALDEAGRFAAEIVARARTNDAGG